MAWEAIVTLLTLFSVLVALVITRVSADLVPVSYTHLTLPTNREV